jgi:hypothetical protein
LHRFSPIVVPGCDLIVSRIATSVISHGDQKSALVESRKPLCGGALRAIMKVAL